jgi:hypothetical protein
METMQPTVPMPLDGNTAPTTFLEAESLESSNSKRAIELYTRFITTPSTDGTP